MKLINPKDARAVAVKRQLKDVKKEIKSCAKRGNGSTIFFYVLFPEVISILKDAGYTTTVTVCQTGVSWREIK